MKHLVMGLALMASPVTAAEFIGPRVEGVIGWDQQRFGDSFRLGDNDRNGALGYGFALGYDAALGDSLIAGVEGGILFADRGLRYGTDDDGGQFRPRRDLELSARVGAKIAERALLYGKIGYTNFEIREGISSAGVDSSQSYKLDGLRLGAGIEVPIGPYTYLKTEYRFSDYARDVQKNDILTGFGVRF